MKAFNWAVKRWLEILYSAVVGLLYGHCYPPDPTVTQDMINPCIDALEFVGFICIGYPLTSVLSNDEHWQPRSLDYMYAWRAEMFQP